MNQRSQMSNHTQKTASFSAPCPDQTLSHAKIALDNKSQPKVNQFVPENNTITITLQLDPTLAQKSRYLIIKSKSTTKNKTLIKKRKDTLTNPLPQGTHTGLWIEVLRIRQTQIVVIPTPINSEQPRPQSTSPPSWIPPQ